MGAVWYRARANLRGRWLGTLVLIVAIALTAGVVLASIAGARRARSALSDFVAYNQAYDALVFADPSPDVQDLLDELSALPQWETAQQVGAVIVSVDQDGHWVSLVPTAYVDGRPYIDQNRPILVSGRLPDPSRADEVAVNEDFADALGLEAGDTFALRTVTPEGLGPIIGGQADPRDPNGEDLTMTATGIIRRPSDLRLSAAQQSEAVGSDSWYLGVGPAFVARFGDRLANFGFGVSGQVKPGQQDDLSAAISALDRDDVTLQSTNEDAALVGSIGRGIDFESNALLVFAVVAAIAAAAFIGQAIGRQVLFDLDDDDALRSMGVDRRHRAAVPLVRSVIVAAIGTMGAVVVAIVASSAFPVGLARQALLDPGIDVDALTLGAGAAAIVTLAVAWAAADAWLLTRGAMAGTRVGAGERPAASLSALAARLGAPVTITAGARLAFERGRGRSAVPVVGAALATSASVVVLSAVLVFAASLSHLVDSPVLQGWNWDGVVGNMNSRADVRGAVEALSANPDVDAFIGYGTGPVEVDGHELSSLVLGPGDREVGPPVLEGRLPATSSEVALGTETLASLGKDIGDTVRAQVAGAPGGPREFRIVGTVTMPAGLSNELGLGSGAVVTLAGARATVGAGPDAVIAQQFLVRFADGVTTSEAVASLRDAFGDASTRRGQGNDVENFQRVQRLPRLLAGLVALVAVATLANALVSSVRRRRRDLATYAAIGFRRRQVAATVQWQATTLALLAVIIGLPLGVAAGRTVWELIADSIGTTATPTVPLVALALVALGTLVAANLVAFLPARSASRTHPATVLRSE